MYRKFRDDPSSVDSSWHEFLVDYSPEPSTESSSPPTTSTASTNGNGSAPAKTEPKTEPKLSLIHI